MRVTVCIPFLSKDFIEKSQNKYLATDEDKNPNLRFVNNAVLQKIEATEELNELLEDRKLNHWQQDDEYVGILWEDLKKSELYEDYLKTRTSDFKEDKDFVIDLFKEIVAPNDKLYDYLEDKKLTWLDDLPIVNTSILKLFWCPENFRNKCYPGVFVEHLLGTQKITPKCIFGVFSWFLDLPTTRRDAGNITPES